MAKRAKYAPIIEPVSQETQRGCATCAKNTLADNACKVLTERIGLTRDCWAWTDDLEWEAVVKQAVQDYGK